MAVNFPRNQADIAPHNKGVMGPRVLVVEDEPDMAALLVRALTESGYICASAPDGEEGLRMAPEYDLVVADIMMPAMNGLAMIGEMRAQGLQTPAIFVTARDTTQDIVRGLDLGADDYLVKPFRLEELLARVRSLLRRSAQTPGKLRCEDLEMDRGKRTVTRGGHPIFLSVTEFALLELLLSKAGEPVSKAKILSEIWHDVSRDENLAEIYINYLRRKTEVHGAKRLIVTVRGQGYVLGKGVGDP